MCWWGEALAHGPNINAPLTPDANKLALQTMAEAQSLVGQRHPAERALIMALVKALFRPARRRPRRRSTALMPTPC